MEISKSSLPWSWIFSSILGQFNKEVARIMGTKHLQFMHWNRQIKCHDYTFDLKRPKKWRMHLQHQKKTNEYESTNFLPFILSPQKLSYLTSHVLRFFSCTGLLNCTNFWLFSNFVLESQKFSHCHFVRWEAVSRELNFRPFMNIISKLWLVVGGPLWL